MQELENENDKLKRECAKLMESIAKTTNFNKGGKTTAAGKEFLGNIFELVLLECQPFCKSSHPMITFLSHERSS
jgi:hypothetical protein